jgi:enterochelin esterase-like enzyme
VFGRRSFLVSSAIALGCTRRDRSASNATTQASALPPLPEMPEAGHPSARGEVGTETWSFDGGNRAVVIAPAWLAAGQRVPMLIALHGRGEAVKGPELGAMGWPHDYELLRAIKRVCAPPLTPTDLEGFVDPKRLDTLNHDLTTKPFGGLVIVCPWLPDLELRKPAQVREYGDYLLRSVIPRARRELPVIDAPESTGIDGVSLGGAVALRVGLENPNAFFAVGTLQAALSDDQSDEFTKLAKVAREKNGKLAIRLLTSKDDYFHGPITHLSQSFRAAGIAHEYVDIPGPHDYPFNRGPGAIEMLVWHDRTLSRGESGSTVQ